ncbi:MAG: GTP 3',8-cyclase MoaA [Desulfomonilaceae bacterium]
MLVDHHGRVIDYLRVSITDLCNLRCIYCRPPEGLKLVSHDDILRYEEILRLIRIGRDLGVRKLRITGGEPLVRRGVLSFIERVTRLDGIKDIGLTTNGVLLESMAADLRAAGLTRINISLDSLRRDAFAAITGRDHLKDVLNGIEASLKVGLNPVKINVVLLEGYNETDVAGFAKLTMDRPIDVRFIERMPFGNGPVPNAPVSFSAYTVLGLVRSQVGELEPMERDALDGPATMFRLKGALGRIGVIDPVTGHFCGSCNRLRLTARGTLRPCLLAPHEIDIRTALRSGAADAELATLFCKAVLEKPVGKQRSPHSLNDAMNMIGG